MGTLQFSPRTDDRGGGRDPRHASLEQAKAALSDAVANLERIRDRRGRAAADLEALEATRRAAAVAAALDDNEDGTLSAARLQREDARLLIGDLDMAIEEAESEVTRLREAVGALRNDIEADEVLALRRDQQNTVERFGAVMAEAEKILSEYRGLQNEIDQHPFTIRYRRPVVAAAWQVDDDQEAPLRGVTPERVRLLFRPRRTAQEIMNRRSPPGGY